MIPKVYTDEDFDRLWWWKSNAKRYYIYDPVDGGKILRNESRDIIWTWCELHCKGKFWIGIGFGQFEFESDAMLFMLRWS